MTTDPSLPARLAAAEAGRIPDDIAKAIRVVLETQRAFSGLDRHPSNREALKASISCSDALDALNAAILARLTAAEAARDEALRERDEYRRALEHMRDDYAGLAGIDQRAVAYCQERDAALARAERAERWLRHMSANPLIPAGYAALAHPAPAEET